MNTRARARAFLKDLDPGTLGVFAPSGLPVAQVKAVNDHHRRFVIARLGLDGQPESTLVGADIHQAAEALEQHAFALCDRALDQKFGPLTDF